MNMTYDGTLVMPSNFVVVDENEMTYVEGGGVLRVTLSIRAIKSILPLAVGAAVALATLRLSPFVGIVAGLAAALVVDYVLNNLVTVKPTTLYLVHPNVPNGHINWK